MSKRLAVAIPAAIGILLLGVLQTPGAAVPPPEPEASAEQLQAVNRAMGDVPGPVPADLTPAPTENETSFGSLVVRVAGVLVFILGLLYVSLYGMRRLVSKQRPAEGEQIRVLGRTPLSPKANVYLLRFGDHYLVVGEAGERLTALASLAAQDELEIEEESSLEPASAEPEAAFSASLNRQQARIASQSTLQRITESVRKLRQETEKLLNIQNGVSQTPPEAASSPSRRKAERSQPVGAEAP